MRDIVDDLKTHGAQLVALTPIVPEHTKGLVEKHRLNFPLLTDRGNRYAEKLGIRFELPPEVIEIYKGFGLDLPGANGDQSWTLPIPCRIVVDTKGIVRVADIDIDYTHRPEPAKTLEDVKALG